MSVAVHDCDKDCCLRDRQHATPAGVHQQEPHRQQTEFLQGIDVSVLSAIGHTTNTDVDFIDSDFIDRNVMTYLAGWVVTAAGLSELL